MLAVHLENGAVSVRAMPMPRAPRRIRPCCACWSPGSAIPTWNCSAATTDSPARPATSSSPRWWRRIRAALVGSRVVGEINLACTQCDWCRKGLGRHCPNRTVLGIVNQPGAFEEFFTLPERNLHVLPDEPAAGTRRLHRTAGRSLRDSGPGGHSPGEKPLPFWAMANSGC